MYFCELCDYQTENRSLIEYHHIVPKELEGSDNSFNRIYVCPNHHKTIYIDGSMSGIHSIKNNESIIIKGKFNSTEGKVLLIENIKGIETYITIKNSN